ncbi:TPA: hypothetical protein DCQ44_00475 [Candidatus Taylorbacteria bacterium]|nr:hypothetical protein [Candidatus Taylorbacteria bacterium]
MDQKTTFYIVRHGETEFNVSGIMQGHTDSPLTEKGQEQAKLVGNALKDIDFDLVFSSDLLRAKRTAEIMLLEKKLAINTTELLRERSYGRYDGRSATEYREENKEMLAKIVDLEWSERSKIKFSPDAESDHEVVSRFTLFLREAAVTYAGKKVLIVTHGGTMRSFLVQIGWGTAKELPGGCIQNTGYVKLVSDGIDFEIQEVVGVGRSESVST